MRDVLDPMSTMIRRPNAGSNHSGEGGSAGSGNGPSGSLLAVAVGNHRKRKRLIAPAILGNGRGAANLLAELKDRDGSGGDAG